MSMAEEIVESAFGKKKLETAVKWQLFKERIRYFLNACVTISAVFPVNELEARAITNGAFITVLNEHKIKRGGSYTSSKIYNDTLYVACYAELTYDISLNIATLIEFSEIMKDIEQRIRKNLETKGLRVFTVEKVNVFIDTFPVTYRECRYKETRGEV